MKSVRISQLKNELSRFLDLVRSGESVLVLDRDTPIARIEPVAAQTASPQTDEEAWLADLDRRGIIRRGRGRRLRSLLEPFPAGPASGVLDALLEERRSGR